MLVLRGISYPPSWGFEGTDLATAFLFPLGGDFYVIPTVCRRHPCNPFPFALSQASLDEFSRKSLAERGGFEPPKPFWSLHAFQACLFNHSSISPSSQLACKKETRHASLACRRCSS